MLGKSNSKDATALLKEYARDQTLTPDIRLQARLALAKSGEVLPPASESGGNLSAVETTFTLAWPADKSDADAVGPGVVEGDARDAREDIDPGRGDPNLEDQVRGLQVLHAQRGEGGSEGLEGGVDPAGVGGRGAHPQIQIACGAGPAVGSEGVGADDEVLSAGVA